MHINIMDLPKISVITPSYNQGIFIEDTIKSILNQNYPNLEYIIIDGGSTDKTIEIIKKYEDRLAYWISEPDNGQTDAINKGFRIATGDIITWLCSDDTYNNNTLRIVGNFFLKYPEIDFLYGNTAAMDVKGKIIREIKGLKINKISVISLAGTISQPSTFYRKTLLSKIGFLDESLHYGMDYEFFLRIIFGNIKTKKINKTLANFRYHENSKTVLASQGKNEYRDKELGELRLAYAKRMKVPIKIINIIGLFFRIKRKFININRYWKYRNSYFNNLL